MNIHVRRIGYARIKLTNSIANDDRSLCNAALEMQFIFYANQLINYLCVASSQLHHAALHGAGGMPVLAPGQDALHRQAAAAGDHRQAAGRAPDILPRLQQRRRAPVPSRQPRDAES